jgi:hypothetical protein
MRLPPGHAILAIVLGEEIPCGVSPQRRNRLRNL